MDNKLNKYGMLVLVVIFFLFYIITTSLLDKRNINKEVIDNDNVVVENNNYENEKKIISDLYKDIRILYDVVNNKFTVSQEDTITIGNIVYKKITNFDEIMNKLC